MSEPLDLKEIRPDRVFDGGDLDCGSGLVLLIRENMQQVPRGGVLEMRSLEPTVAADLPPWCRMVGHEFLGVLPGERPKEQRYFVRKGTTAESDDRALASDKDRAREYEWRARVRATGGMESTVYCRNFSFRVGQPASFEERDTHPSALEYLIGALGSDLSAGFTNECNRSGLTLDDLEITVRATLRNILAHLGIEDGDPSAARIEVKCFASSLEKEAEIRDAWERTLRRSPLWTTLSKAVELESRLVIL